MKSLADIQLELRRLTETIENLNTDIEQLKSKDEVSSENSLEMIEIVAEKYPIHNVRLSQAEDYQKKYYIQVLSMIAQKDTKYLGDKMLYIYRIVVGCKCDFTIDDIKKFGVANSQEFYGEACNVLEELKNCLILDALMIINMHGEVTQEELLFVAEIAEILKCNTQDLSIITQLATALLEMDGDKFCRISAEKSFAELNYLIPEKWIESSRTYCGYLECISSPVLIALGALEGRKIFKTKGFAEQGEVLAEEKRNSKVFGIAHEGKKIIAGQKGFIKVIKDKKQEENRYEQDIDKFWIVSCFEDEIE